MRRIFVIEPVKGVKVNCPNGAYHEDAKIGRYVVRAIFLPEGGYIFYVFKGDELKAIVGNDDWFVSKLDGEGQNLLNRLISIYG